MKRSYLVLVLLLLVSVVNAQTIKTVPAITAQDIMDHISFLASEQLKGRNAGSEEGRIAAAYISNQFERFGLKPSGENGSFFQPFSFIKGVNVLDATFVSIGKGEAQSRHNAKTDFIPLGFSGEGKFSGEAVFVGYGITAKDLEYDDYDGVDVDGKVAVAFMYNPEPDNPHSELAAFEQPRRKAMTARQNNASALVLVYGYDEEDALPKLNFDPVGGDAGIPVLHMNRTMLEKLFEGSGVIAQELEETIRNTKKPVSHVLKGTTISGTIDLDYERANSQNVLGFLKGSNPAKSGNMIVIGAHYDHIGLGGESSRAPSREGEVHNGADDNASGTAGLLELAEILTQPEYAPEYSVLFIAFGAEEIGLLGSKAYVDDPFMPLEKINFMMNMDMIGRMKNNTLTLNGTGSAANWHELTDKINEDYNFEIAYSDGGLGGSDHTSFYSKDVPVVFFFTGTHSEYHLPEDDIELINSKDEEKIVRFAFDLFNEIDGAEEKMVYTRAKEQSQGGASRSFNVTFGIVPDYAGGDVVGLSVTDVVEGGAAKEAGMLAGDLILKIDDKEIRNIYDYMFMLGELKPGDEAAVVVKRDGVEVALTVKLQKRARQ